MSHDNIKKTHGLYVVEKVNNKNKSFILLMLLLSIPFIQLGLNYYLSVQVLTFIMLFLLIPANVFLYSAPVGLAVFSLMCIPVFSAVNSADAMHDLLKTAREFTCYLPIYGIIKYKDNIVSRVDVKLKIINAIPLILLGLTFLTIIQYYFLKSGVYLALPYELYVRNAGTLPDELDLIYSKIRPSATFGEPSYLGFVVVSFLILALRIFRKPWLKILMISCIILNVYFCQSASGQLAVFLLLLIELLQSKTTLLTKVSVIFIACLVVFVAWMANFSTLERLSNFSDRKQESSGYARLAAPAIIASEVLLNSPLGVVNSQLEQFVTGTRAMSKNDLAGALSNGFYNLLINYGLTGFLLLGLLLMPIRKDWLVMCYIILTTSFNGAFLCFDKSAVIVSTLFLLFYFSADGSKRLVLKDV
jgi:hypothetical protein